MRKEKDVKVVIELDGYCLSISESLVIKGIEESKLHSISSSGLWENEDYSVVLMVDYQGNLVESNLVFINESSREDLWRKYGFKKNYIKSVYTREHKKILAREEAVSISLREEW